jgi:ATP/ADP translocase
MHRTIAALSRRLLQVRPGEGRKVLLTFLYFCLVITAYYVVKPVSRSLVLGDLGSRLVPYGDLVSAILMGPMVALFARLVDRVEKRRLVSLTFWAVAASLVGFWVLLQHPHKWIAAALYVWVAIFSVLVVTLFWLVANDLFHPRDAKRLFGFIGSGGILGSVFGSALAAVGARWVGTPQLLLVSASLLIICWMVVQRLWRFALEPANSRPSVAGARGSGISNLLSIVKRLGRSRYLVLLVGLVGIAKIVSTLVYYQFNPFVEQMFLDRDARTAFLALFSGWTNIAALVVQFFLTSWVLRRLGLTTALLVLPIGLLAGSAGLLINFVFVVAAATELFDGSLNYSLQQSSKEVLYLPIDRSIRYKIKPFIDMVVFRFGKGLAAVVGIVMLDVMHLPAQTLSYLTIPLLAAWVVLALALRRDYVRTIRAILQARVDRQEQDGAGAEGTAEGAGRSETVVLEEWLESLALRRDVATKLVLASQLLATQGARSEDSRSLLDALAEYEDGFLDFGHVAADLSAERLIECLSDRRQPMPVRRAAIRRLVNLDGQQAVDALIGMLTVEEDATVRHELIRGLTILRLRHRHGLEFPRRLIHHQIATEVRVYQRILVVAMLYRRSSLVNAGRSDQDPALLLLRLLLEETVQQIFQLLSLLCRPEDIYLVYMQLQEPEAHVRADAIELLDNLVDPSLRWLVFPVLDENHFMERIETGHDGPSIDDPETHKLLQEGIWDHNCWLSVVIFCLVGRLRVEPLLEELDVLQQDEGSLLGLGAKLARQLAGIRPGE